MQKAAVFEKTYRYYLDRIANLDLAALAPKLGFMMQGSSAVVSMYGRPYTICAQGLRDRQGRQPDLGVCVILFKYLLMCPQNEPRDHSLFAFKDFKDAGPLVTYFTSNAHMAVAKAFRGRPEALAEICEKVGGSIFENDLSYQVKYRFQGLPKIPVYLLFNDEEEHFPAQCTLLFQRSAGSYLDMESLSILGVLLAQRIVGVLSRDSG